VENESALLELATVSVSHIGGKSKLFGKSEPQQCHGYRRRVAAHRIFAAENELRNAVAKRVARAAASDEREDAGANLSTVFPRWTETMQALQVKNSRVALVSQTAARLMCCKALAKPPVKNFEDWECER
jgi:hypothetical protein